MKKALLGIIFILVVMVAFADVSVNGTPVANGGTLTLYKNISKQDIGLQGGSNYYLLSNIPIKITSPETVPFKISYSCDSFATIFSNSCNFYLGFNGTQYPLQLLQQQNGVQVTSGTFSSNVNTTFSLFLTGQNPIVTNQLGSSQVINLEITYGANFENNATIQVVVAYQPSSINKPDGDAKDIQKPKVVSSALYFDLGETNKVGQKPMVTNAKQSAQFYSATRNLNIAYVPGYIQDLGVPYSYSVVVNGNAPFNGAFNSSGSFTTPLPESADQYAPFGFDLTVFPSTQTSVYTKSGVISINGQFVLTYYN